jgi:DNA invertase Pin-like site-specific DNA recombinase
MTDMRVAIYTRISIDEEHQPYWLDAQDTRLSAYIASQDGWELVRRYSDCMTARGDPGRVGTRPQSRSCLEECAILRLERPSVVPRQGFEPRTLCLEAIRL